MFFYPLFKYLRRQKLKKVVSLHLNSIKAPMSFASSIIFPLIKGVFSKKGDTSNQYTAQMFQSFHREDDENEDRFVYDKRVIYAGERELDIFLPPKGKPQRGAVIYSPGGGFIVDFREYYSTRRLAYKIAQDGYLVAIPQYRMGLRTFGKKNPLRFGSALQRAIFLVVEDIFLVTRYLLDNAEELGVKKDRIVLLGSSSGSFPSLQCDMERCKGSDLFKRILPEDFSYAAIISLCGAVFSSGKPDYGKGTPAPTMFIHGTRDDLVPYKRCTLFGYGLYGPYSIVRVFRKKKCAYRFMHFVDQGHSVAARYLNVYDDIFRFIGQALLKTEMPGVDEYIREPFRQPIFLDYANPIVLFKGVLSQLKLKPVKEELL